MENGASGSSDGQALPADKTVPSNRLEVDIASPTVDAYLDPPPTYHHATEDGAVGGQSGSSTEEENIPSNHRRRRSKSYRSETIISTTTTTTRTSTTSLTTKRPGPSRLSSISKLPRSKSTDSIMSTTSKSSDPYLDALLARSIAALELSNALLQSTLVTKSTLSSVLAGDEALEKRERAFEERLLRSANTSFRGEEDPNSQEGKKMEWMREMEGIVRDVEALFDVSPPSTSTRQRRSTLDSQQSPTRREGGLVYGDHSAHTRAPPPRALTQYVSISGANANASAGEATAGKHEIYLPSTTGLRRGPHRETLGERKGHSPAASTSSWRGGESSQYLAPIPATHPESLPLSPQELLERHSESSSPVKPAQEATDRHAYLRRFGAHSGTPSVSSDGLGAGGSTNSTLSRTRSKGPVRPTLTPYQPASLTGPSPTQTPSISGFTAFPSLSAHDLHDPGFQGPQRHRHADHSRTSSNMTTDSIVSAPSNVSVPSTASHSRRSSRSSTRSSLSLANVPFSLSLPLPSSIGAAFRRSPSLRGFGSPTSTEGSDIGEGGYSPALEAIGDFGEEGDDDVSGSDLRGRNPSVKSPTRGRAILRGRFRTADTLRRILDTSPSPLSLSKPTSVTSPIDKGKSIARDIAPTSRSNTHSSNRTITRKMRDSFASAEDPLALPIPTSASYTLATSKAGMHSASDIHSIHSSHSFVSARSPSTVSSTSDLHSSDMDRERGVKKRLSLRPAPRFMPRTPSGRTALLEVSGATARTPMMHAHLIDLESPVVIKGSEPTPVTDSNPVNADRISPLPFEQVSLKLPDPSSPNEIQERRRTQSLSTSVSSMLGQARALEGAKFASAGKFKGGSNLKGSPAWQAQRKLVDHASLDGAPSAPHSPSIHHDPMGSGSNSKRTSWISASFIGLGLAITPSSSNASGANTPPMRVSFAKEPVRYSEERERVVAEDEEDDEDEGEVNTKDLDAEIDGSLTIKPRSVRRTKSWNGSVKGAGSRRVPSKRRSKVESKEKKEGWLEWFLTATTAGAGGGPGHMGVSSSSMGIGREEMFESRGRDDW